jgi:hypothetical protein
MALYRKINGILCKVNYGDAGDILDEFEAQGGGDVDDLIAFIDREFEDAVQSEKNIAIKELERRISSHNREAGRWGADRD